MTDISQETIDCMVQHIKAFHEQDACKKKGRFWRTMCNLQACKRMQI